jgi:hypothetical protein
MNIENGKKLDVLLKGLEYLIRKRNSKETLSWSFKKKRHRAYSIFQRRVLQPLKLSNSHSISKESDTKIRPYLIKGREYWANSQSGQDLFAQLVFAEGISHCYLELGSSWPDRISNTYILEKFKGWRGLSLDIDPRSVLEFNRIRRNIAHVADATKLDYLDFCISNSFEPKFDYLSVDIDPSFQSYFALRNLMRDGVHFSIITFEHDKYRSGPLVQFASFLLLSRAGYVRVARDIQAKGFGKYEDWWAAKSSFPADDLKKIKADVILIRQALQV